MKKNIAIEVKGVYKKFSKDLTHTAKYGLIDISKSVIGLNVNTSKLRSGEFWAVNNLSFQVKEGENLGIVGPNGSGKTTLLQLLNGIYMPDRGSIKVRGRVGALIAVGAGFHQMLTGRENIYVNGSILGMTKKEIDEKLDEIVDFADIGDFLDAPVRNYSSGMYIRLGFAIAINSSPEVLLVDEVLAVGDQEFRRKCFRKMSEIINKGTTIILVSHNMRAIRDMCDRTIYLKNGKLVSSGETNEIVDSYLREHQEDLSVKSNVKGIREGDGEVVISNISFQDSQEKPVKHATSGDELRIVIDYLAKGDRQIDSEVSLVFYNLSNDRMFKCTTAIDQKGTLPLRKKGRVVCTIPKFALPFGEYIVDTLIKEGDIVHDKVHEATLLKVVDGDFFNKNYIYRGWYSSGVLVNHYWKSVKS